MHESNNVPEAAEQTCFYQTSYHFTTNTDSFCTNTLALISPTVNPFTPNKFLITEFITSSIQEEKKTQNVTG